MTTRPLIVVVDDEPDLRDIVRFNLEAEGFDVCCAASAEEALTLPLPAASLLLLDVMMDGMSGFALAERLKTAPATARLPIIFLTALGTESDTLRGFALGADDYMAKPFSVRELVMRVKAVLRRAMPPAAAPPADAMLRFEGLAMDDRRKLVTADGQPVELTATEYALLRLLLSEPRRVFSRDELMQRVWPSDVLVGARTVDVAVTRLRKKIGRYAAHVVTRQKFGYCFEP